VHDGRVKCHQAEEEPAVLPLLRPGGPWPSVGRVTERILAGEGHSHFPGPFASLVFFALPTRCSLHRKVVLPHVVHHILCVSINNL